MKKLKPGNEKVEFYSYFNATITGMAQTNFVMTPVPNPLLII